MANAMQFDLVSPERSLASLQAIEVRIPGTDGDLTAMPDHAPLITTMRPGVLTVVSDAGETRYAVTGGFAEINATGTTVLAERAIPVEDLTSEDLTSMAQDAAKARDNATPEQLDALAKQVSDIGHLGDQLGISVNIS